MDDNTVGRVHTPALGRVIKKNNPQPFGGPDKAQKNNER